MMNVKAGFIRTLGVGIAVLSGAASALATDYTWTNSAGGNFGVAGNWNPAGGPPGSADTALFSQGSGTRKTITFPAGTATTAGLKLYKNNADNKYEFAIANGGVNAIYQAGETKLGNTWQDRCDLLISDGTLASGNLTSLGYDSIAKLTLDGPDTLWRVTKRIAFSQTTVDIDILNGATLEAQGVGGATGNHEIWTENLDSNYERQQYIRVVGQGSRLICTNLNTDFRSKGHAWLQILNGAEARFEHVAFGNSSLTQPHFYVVVSNATLRTKDIYFSPVGANKTYGHLDILAGATVVSEGNAYIDGYEVTACTARVDNASWRYTGVLRVGSRGQASLVVTNGGSVVGTNSLMSFPYFSGRPVTNSVFVSGAGSIFKTRSMFPGGDDDSDNTTAGYLYVTDGGVLDQVDSTANRFIIWSKGVMNLDYGIVSNASPLQVKGRLRGRGVISGSVLANTAAARMQPDGQISIGGAYTQSTGQLEIDIAGTTPVSGYDVLAMRGNATFTGGKLKVSTSGKVRSGRWNYDVVTSQGTIATNGLTFEWPTGVAAWSAAIVSTDTGRALRLTSKVPLGTAVLVR
jgi:T5SS/PEP-CTERM-associated repeat protein